MACGGQIKSIQSMYKYLFDLSIIGPSWFHYVGGMVFRAVIDSRMIIRVPFCLFELGFGFRIGSDLIGLELFGLDSICLCFQRGCSLVSYLSIGILNGSCMDVFRGSGRS